MNTAEYHSSGGQEATGEKPRHIFPLSCDVLQHSESKDLSEHGSKFDLTGSHSDLQGQVSSMFASPLNNIGGLFELSYVR